ncbi:MAG: phosphoribosyl-AMP cyclohydrolase [Acidobacteria bacterium]|nr:phosphoribosyl-AMP cyclohydrolase [Acidobacteriota bacterium]
MVNFEKAGGLIPAVIQESGTGKVLMLGYMNAEAFENTLQTGKATFFSRSRNKLWVKGESSGHVLKVHDVLVDCDEDAVLIVAEQVGSGTCHNGYQSCFYRRVQSGTLVEAEPRAFDPDAVYAGVAPATKTRQE